VRKTIYIVVQNKFVPWAILGVGKRGGGIGEVRFLKNKRNEK
jgi:hypothetical protein